MKILISNLFRVKYIEKINHIIRSPYNSINYYYHRFKEEVMFSHNFNEIKSKQDNNIKKQYSNDIKKLILFLVPGWDGVNGGVMSICSLARVSKLHKSTHGSEVMIATLPNHKIFSEYTKFESGLSIFRFDQIASYFSRLEEIIIHVPENFVNDFRKHLDSSDIKYLKEISKVTINVMNQNPWYMPTPKDFDKLREIATEVTITVAHRKYCTRELRDDYNCSIHLFSTSNLTDYKYRTYYDKKDILLTSIDDNPLKEEILCSIRNKFPNLKLKQIENMDYSEYKEWISISKWMITFGEGLDGYFVESIRSGAIPFAVYNPDFFSDRFEDLPNVYESYELMLEQIADDIESYDNSKDFKLMNDKLIALDKDEYNDKEYINNVKEYYEQKYDWPVEGIEIQKKQREERLRRRPLVSIVLATYNGEKFLKKQLDSLSNLTYENLELVVSDDNSNDLTEDIIKTFSAKAKFPIYFYKNNGDKGVNGNFENALNHANGEYIALCDQDDIWLPNKIELLLEKIDDFDIIHSNVTLIDENDKFHTNKVLRHEYEGDLSSKVKFLDYISTGWILGCTSLIKADLVKKSLPFPKDIFFHDWWITLIALKEGNGVKYIHEPTIMYRQHCSNTAQSIYSSSDWMYRKINFNKLIMERFEGSLSRIEKIALRNNLNYCASKYYLITDYKREYKKVNTFIDENKDILSRDFLKKFVETVATDVRVEYEFHNRKVPLKSKISYKVQNPRTKFDKLFRRVYLYLIKPTIVEPYRKLKNVY